MSVTLNINGTNYNQYFTQIIDSVEYVLHVHYNARSGWYISFYDSEIYDEEAVDNTAALIYGGRKLMPFQDVLSRISDERLPQGVLLCADTELAATAELLPVGLNNFGTGQRYNLVYYTEQEVAELSAT